MASVEPLKLPTTDGLIDHLLFFLYWRDNIPGRGLCMQEPLVSCRLRLWLRAVLELHEHNSSLEESVTVSLKNERLNQELIKFFHLL